MVGRALLFDQEVQMSRLFRHGAARIHGPAFRYYHKQVSLSFTKAAVKLHSLQATGIAASAHEYQEVQEELRYHELLKRALDLLGTRFSSLNEYSLKAYDQPAPMALSLKQARRFAEWACAKLAEIYTTRQVALATGELELIKVGESLYRVTDLEPSLLRALLAGHHYFQAVLGQPVRRRFPTSDPSSQVN